MSTAQVINSGIVGPVGRAVHPRGAASSSGFVDPLAEAFSTPARGQAREYEEDFDSGDHYLRRRRRYTPYQDPVVSFGGVLVSREVGATIMQVQASLAGREPALLGAEAERGIAIYEFNQSLMGAAQVVTEVGLSH
jgi:hypothetical protein